MGKRTDLEQNQRLAGTVVFVGTAGSSRNLELASRSEEVVDLAVEVAEAAEAVEVVEAVEVAEAVEVVEPVVELLAETLERLRSPTLRSRKKHQLRRLAVAIQRLKLQSPLRPLR